MATTSKSQGKPPVKDLKVKNTARVKGGGKTLDPGCLPIKGK